MFDVSCEKAILVVEDDYDILEAIVEILSDRDYRAIAASNGREALERLRSAARLPCLILLDIMMPVMDGREFRAAQREDRELRSIPVVVLSAHENGPQLATELGASGFLRKPLQIQELFAMIERLCSVEP